MQHTEPALSYIRVTWRMLKLYHLRALQALREQGDYPDLKSDIVASAYEAAYESKGEFSFSAAREKTRQIVARWFNYRTLFSETPSFRESADCPPKLRSILAYYELDTFEGTCQKFGIAPTQKNRKLFSQACPKPELGGHNGVAPNHADKVQVQPNWTTRYIVDTYKVSRITAWRAKKRGYLYKPAGRVGKLAELFSAKDIMNALLNSQHQQEIIATLQVSESYSFYFRINGVKYRVSNHAPRHWSLRMGEEEWIDISPAGNSADKDILLNSISSPQTEQTC